MQNVYYQSNNPTGISQAFLQKEKKIDSGFLLCIYFPTFCNFFFNMHTHSSIYKGM